MTSPSSTSVDRSWTTVRDLIDTLQKRWLKGDYLRNYALEEDWQTLSISVRAPKADELLDRLDEAILWLKRFERDRHTTGGQQRFAVEYRDIKSKTLGTNRVPIRMTINSFDQLCKLLGTETDVITYDAILDQTRSTVAPLQQWVREHPLQAIANAAIWDQVLDVVLWVAEHETPHLFLRHIDVEGVDTKFIERNQRLLDELLMRVLPTQRIDLTVARTDFAGRFRFLRKPAYTRFRLLGNQMDFPAGISELTLRSDEFATMNPSAETIFIVENETSYLAFPEVSDSLVVFGSGFALGAVGSLPWLNQKRIMYWGDIDTHGFVILDRLRSLFENVQSMLMDHTTLLAHPQQWVTESSPTNQPLSRLTDAETELYRDLIEDRYGQRVRLEQERVRFSLLRQALTIQPSALIESHRES